MCVGVSSAYMSVSHMCPRRPEEGRSYSHYLGHLEEQPVILIVEPSLQSHELFVLNKRNYHILNTLILWRPYQLQTLQAMVNNLLGKLQYKCMDAFEIEIYTENLSMETCPSKINIF